MFGYVTINKPELKIKDYERYRGFYCGICRSLRRYGVKGRMTLNYDMVFVAILLSGLYEGHEKKALRRCVLHPSEKLLTIENEYVDYAADMTILMSYFDLEDDWADDRSIPSHAAAELLKNSAMKVADEYPRQYRAIRQYVKDLGEFERSGEESLDRAASLTGKMLSELLIYKEDEWSPQLGRLGFYLGKFIYLMDAYEDLEEDEKSGNYNPLMFKKDSPDLYEWMADVLGMMMAECAAQFERLPILRDVEILRNILYSGVWVRFEAISQKRTGENNGSV